MKFIKGWKSLQAKNIKLKDMKSKLILKRGIFNTEINHWP